MNDIRAITIDLDDTLWEIHPVIHRAERRLYAWLGEHYPRITEMFSAAAILEMRSAIWQEFPELSHDYTFMRSTVLSRIGSAAGYDDSLIDDALLVFNAARNDVELFPEVRPALEALCSKYVLIAVTNGNADLQQIGIDDFFHDLVSARAVGVAKPARRIFEIAVSAGGAAAHQTVHVGDHPEFDVSGARDAGLKTVWVNRGGHKWPRDLAKPDGIVTHIGQLNKLLANARP